MSSLPQQLIDALTTELVRVFGPRQYTVEAREPAEGELLAREDAKQIFITTEGLEPGTDIADMGESTQVILPVMVACVMRRPGNVILAAQVLRRRLTLVQAVQRVMRDFNQAQTGAQLRFIQEQPTLIEGYFVSVTGLELEFDLDAEDTL